MKAKRKGDTSSSVLSILQNGSPLVKAAAIGGVALATIVILAVSQMSWNADGPSSGNQVLVDAGQPGGLRGETIVNEPDSFVEPEADLNTTLNTLHNETGNGTKSIATMSPAQMIAAESAWSRVVSQLCQIAAQGLLGDSAGEAEIRCKADAEQMKWKFMPLFNLTANLSAGQADASAKARRTPAPVVPFMPDLARPVGSRPPSLAKPGASGFPVLITAVDRESRLNALMHQALLESMTIDSARFTDRAVTSLYGRIHPMSYTLADEYKSRRPLVLLYHKSPFHWQWHIDQHLMRVQRPIQMIVDGPGTRHQDHSIVVVNHLSYKNCKKYFADVQKKGHRNIAALHQGDIGFSQSYEWYRQVKFVLRNHYPARTIALKKKMPLEHTYILPLGSLTHDSMSFTNNGEFNRLQPASRRKHLCNFIGNLGNHPNRGALANGLKESGLGPGPKEFHYKLWGTGGGVKCMTFYSGADWKSKKQMQPHEYRAAIQESAFTFAPQGRGPSSFRLSEALELGSIPVLSDIDTVHLPYGEHPLPVIENSQWETAPSELMKMYAENPEMMDELQRRVFTWWRAWKHAYQLNLACLVERDVMASAMARTDCLTPMQFGGYAISKEEIRLIKAKASKAEASKAEAAKAEEKK